MISGLILAALLGASPPARTYVALGAEDLVLLVDTEKHCAKSIADLPRNISSVTVSPDGAQLFFTTKEEGGFGKVFSRSTVGGPVRSVEVPAGYAGDVHVDWNSGRLFLAHINGPGEPNKHARMRFSQIATVSKAGATSHVTEEEGCHYSPTRAGQHLYFVHSLCNWVDFLVERANPDGSQRKTLHHAKVPIHELDVSADEKWVVAVESETKTHRLVLIEVATGQTTELATVEIEAKLLFPRFSGASSLFYVYQGRVVEVDLVTRKTSSFLFDSCSMEMPKK